MSVVDGDNRKTAYHNFIYTDDLCVTAQYTSSTEVERTIGDALDTHDYRSPRLPANSDKTQVTAFHLRTEEEKRSLKVVCNKTELGNTYT